MPTYLLIDDASGKIVEHWDTMQSDVAACAFGANVLVDGVSHTKMVTFPGVAVEPEWAHLAFSLDPDDPAVPHVVEKNGARFAAFLNRREIDNCQAEMNARPGNHMRMQYDYGAHTRR